MGAPIGAAVGFASAPWLIAVPRQIAIARAAAVALAATFVGLIAWSAWQTQGPFPLPFATAVYVASGAVALIGFPPALVVSLMATYALRRLAPHADRLLPFALVLIAMCAVACVVMLPQALSPQLD
jgi:uncharacterized membrane protein